jgi:hypothetical protein
MFREAIRIWGLVLPNKTAQRLKATLGLVKISGAVVPMQPTKNYRQICEEGVMTTWRRDFGPRGVAISTQTSGRPGTVCRSPLLAIRLRKSICWPDRYSEKNRCNISARSRPKQPSFQRAASPALPNRSTEQRVITAFNQRCV